MNTKSSTSKGEGKREGKEKKRGEVTRDLKVITLAHESTEHCGHGPQQRSNLVGLMQARQLCHNTCQGAQQQTSERTETNYNNNNESEGG